MKSTGIQRKPRPAQSPREPYLTLEGTIHEGAVVLEGGASIPDGTRVRVVVSENAVAPETFQELLAVAKTKPPARASAEMAPWKRRLLLGTLALLTAGCVFGVWELVAWWTIVPPELVGKWIVADGAQEGNTFDFFRGGTAEARVNIDGREGLVKATIRVDGKNLQWTTYSQAGAKDVRTKIIRALTAHELVLEEQNGKLLKMHRAQ
jgi:uncharacterized protein (TIGR03066 family)